MNTKITRNRSHLPYALILPLYLAMYMLAEQLVVDEYWVSWIPLDNHIPFCKWFVLPYVSWYAFMILPGILLMLKNGESFKKYMLYVAAGFFSALIFCLIFPNGQDLRPPQLSDDHFCDRLLMAIYSADTNTNVCPSMHVIGSLGVVFAAWHNFRGRLHPLRWLTLLHALVICASTVLVKQHSILDVFIGIPWALICGWLVYRPKWLIRKGIRNIS